jgi:hypothetical protein
MLAFRLAATTATAAILLMGYQALKLHRSRLRRQAAKTVAPLEIQNEAGPRLAATVRTEFDDHVDRQATPTQVRPTGTASMHGTILGLETDASELSVSAQAAGRNYAAEIAQDGHFFIHLPPASYTLLAESPTQVATVEVLDLKENEDREVILRLTNAATIAGTVATPPGSKRRVEVRILRAETQANPGATQSNERGEFEAGGLVPGWNYDLRFSSPGLRSVTLQRVRAPAQGIAVSLEPAAKLRGGFGLSAGERCPMETASVDERNGQTFPSDVDGSSVAFDRDCRFEFDDLPEVPRVRVSASGRGWHFEVDVELPAHGDPPFLCFHPPCRDPDQEPRAELELSVRGTTPGAFVVVLSLGEHGTQRQGCPESPPGCLLENLPVTAAADVRIFRRDCMAKPARVALNPGKNYLVVDCEPVKEIAGIVRAGPSEDLIAPWGAVRCTPESSAHGFQGFSFSLDCPANLAAIEYRNASDKTWRPAPIRSSSDGTRGLVEIQLL